MARLAFFFFFLPAIFAGLICTGQIKKDPDKMPELQLDTPVVKEKLWIVYEVVPEFPGGLEKLQEFIHANLRPVKGAAGKRLILSFIVEKDGSLTDIKVARGINDEADREAVRVIKLSPKWKPGHQAGKLMRVAYSIPVLFN